ncbi:transcriptional regulator [Wenyingzhuangia fucanilytica]|uniref:Transcriptional regulator n=1 Tax=Wenyingzhuangia fucanilytica TaxID=1790137 RepID=A0A1B1Y532_9FLAO|nr:GntR family transcriptional regulator [Wenyingzhuangia fucanilytica]ANW95849.1 transcriptional regulator [Wenyingzhuangia fucanilytica]
MEILNYIDVNKNSRVPMYLQIVNSIVNNISNGNIGLNKKLPSINTVSEDFYLSRDTVERAYNILKKQNIIKSIPRRGNYVVKTELTKLNILFLINKLSSYKMRIYNAFVDQIGDDSKVDLKIYNCDELNFVNVLKSAKESYDYFVIMPHFKTENLEYTGFTDAAFEEINSIPKDKLMILDNTMPPVDEDVTAVYQEYDQDIYDALNKGVNKILKYKKIVLIYPDKSAYPYPIKILKGFKKFCLEKDISFEIVNEVCDGFEFKKGELFITIEEADLVNLINQIRENKLVLGEDVGVISYNDTPLKSLLGITVMSIDFKAMGTTAAKMILNKDKGKVKVPFNFIDRMSI